MTYSSLVNFTATTFELHKMSFFYIRVYTSVLGGFFIDESVGYVGGINGSFIWGCSCRQGSGIVEDRGQKNAGGGSAIA